MPNHLANTTSPYLLQHASNPVDWYPWGTDAIQKAFDEDKPIFLSIGYAACHWCHVMAHESFEDAETASLMNKYFINIKVDREERPDLDSIYMAAVVTLTGQGGWPMSLFITPDLKPFYGGTYFPPHPGYGKPAFKDVLLAIAEAWHNQRKQILHSSQQITSHLQQQSAKVSSQAEFSPALLEMATRKIIADYDWLNGGWGAAPKFPQAMTVEFLLRLAHAGDDQALKAAQHTLTAMSRGGMYDVIGGGFSRYSTDNHWHIPHFEKMLYDNALLALVYLHAWQVTHEPVYRQVVEQTLDFVVREMLDAEGGFYSSLDADSEGEEGKYYLWTTSQIREVLGEKSVFFEMAYGINAEGSQKSRIVLQRAVDNEVLASHFALSKDQVVTRLGECHNLLYQERIQRVRPATDDKVLAGWNGLMLRTFAEASRVLDNSNYHNIATRNANFILTALRPNGSLCHAWRAGQVGKEVFLEDYAALILGLLELYQSDFNLRWFQEAKHLAQQMIDRFSDPMGGFFDTAFDAQNLLIRPNDFQDNATPSGNALATEALFKLVALDEIPGWRELAQQSLKLVSGVAPNYPNSFFILVGRC